MKYRVWAILLAILLFAATSWGQDSKGHRLNPDDMASYLLEETISQTKFIRPSFKSFETDTWYLKFLEYFSKVEYGIEQETFFPEHGLFPQKHAIVTRFQLFEKPVYLTFSFSE